VFSLAAGALGVNHILANTLSFTAGLAVNYLLSASWVFRTETNNKARDFAVFSVIGIIGLGLTNLLLYLFIDLGIMLRIFYFLREDMILMLSKMITVAIVLVWNFSARKKFLFRANAT
jgi:putative flippase GtrA